VAVVTHQSGAGLAGREPYHGTQMCSLIAGDGEATGVQGVAPETTLLYSRFNKYDTDSFLASLVWAREQGAKVISMSLQLLPECPRAQEEISGHPEVLYVTSSGNNVGDETSVPDALYPACYKDVLVIGAHDKDGVPWESSYRNKNLMMLAPGVEVRKPVEGSKTFDTTPGTSDACALASGLLAIVVAWFDALRPLTPAAERRKTLIEGIVASCRPVKPEDKEYDQNKTGSGIFDPLAAIGEIGGPHA